MSRAPSLALAVCLASLCARAQEMELDLSAPADQPKAPPDFSLDFSEPVEVVPPELRPVLVIAGVRSAESAEDVVTLGRAQLVQQELVRLASEGDQFKTVLLPDEVSAQLGTGTAAVRACADWACFEKAVKQLKGERMVVAELKSSGAGTVVTLRLYDPGFSELLVVTHDSQEVAQRTFAGIGGTPQAQKDKDFLKKVSPFLANGLKKLSTANGKLLVDNADASAVVTIDGVEAGTGSFDAVVARGAHVVKVAAPGFLPFEQRVSVGAKEEVPVKVLLVAKPVEVPALVAEESLPGPPLYTRPGLYVAAAGVAVIGAGIAFGVMAKGTEARAAQVDEHGVSPLTRAQARAAVTQATIANVLLGAGAAVAAGGAVWMFITPTVTPPAKRSVDPADTGGGGFGVMAGLGGRF